MVKWYVMMQCNMAKNDNRWRTSCHIQTYRKPQLLLDTVSLKLTTLSLLTLSRLANIISRKYMGKLDSIGTCKFQVVIIQLLKYTVSLLSLCILNFSSLEYCLMPNDLLNLRRGLPCAAAKKDYFWVSWHWSCSVHLQAVQIFLFF